MRLVTKEKQKEKNKGKTEKEEEALMMLYPCTKVVLWLKTACHAL